MAQGSAKKQSLDHGELKGNADDDHSFYPKGTLGYAEVTSFQTGISTETDLTNLSVTVTVGESRRIRITASSLVACAAVNAKFSMRIKEGTTQYRTVEIVSNEADEEGRQLAEGSVVLTPSAGSHTYKLTGEVDTSTAEIQNASTDPSFILVEDIGPA